MVGSGSSFKDYCVHDASQVSLAPFKAKSETKVRSGAGKTTIVAF